MPPLEKVVHHLVPPENFSPKFTKSRRNDEAKGPNTDVRAHNVLLQTHILRATDVLMSGHRVFFYCAQWNARWEHTVEHTASFHIPVAHTVTPKDRGGLIVMTPIQMPGVNWKND